MSRSSFALTAAAVAWFSLLGFGYYELFSPNQIAHSIRGSGKVHFDKAVVSAGSLGGSREAELIRQSKVYAASHPDAAPAILDGKSLAPAEFLNQQLKDEGAKWRVRAVHGMDAELYDVS